MFLVNRAVDFFLEIVQRIPPIVLHNMEKAKMLKLVFWHLAVDRMQGDYIEFGVAQGGSLKAAILANKFSKSKLIGVEPIHRNFWGFDTFQKFLSENQSDKEHPTWQGSRFNSNYEIVTRRFRKFNFVKLIAVDVSYLHDKYPTPIPSLGISKQVAVIFFDMDLYGPTLSALSWVSPLIGQGTFLIFDESFAFSGDIRKGEAAALTQFMASRDDINLRYFGSYGAGGVVYIVDLK
jgi:hypothetical protein